MTPTRAPAPRALLAAMFAALSCGGCRGVLGEDADPEPTGDTGVPAGFVPTRFGLTGALFTVDASGSIGPSIDAAVAAAPIPVTVEITLADAAFDGALPSDHACTVTLTVADGFAPSASGPPPAAATWLRFDLPGTAEVADDCAAKDLPDAWADPSAVFGGHPFALGVGPLAASTRAQLAADWYAFDTLEPYLLGGGYTFGFALQDPWADGWVDTPLTLAYTLADDGSVLRVDGERVLIDAATAELPGGGVAEGQYELQGVTLLGPASLLLDGR